MFFGLAGSHGVSYQSGRTARACIQFFLWFPTSCTLQGSPSCKVGAGANIQGGIVPSDSGSLIHSHHQTARANIQICAKSQILTPMEMIRRRRRVKKPLLL